MFALRFLSIICAISRFWGLSVTRVLKTSQSRLGGFQSDLVGAIMETPLYTPIVNTARSTIVRSAESIGVDWRKKVKQVLASSDWNEDVKAVEKENPSLVASPAYYTKRFHGYLEGNLCLESAIEQELAGKAIGARNFPKSGAQGEELLRSSFESQFAALNGMASSMIANDAVVVDMGCGTGTSTRRLANQFLNATKIIGLDLSPYMIAVGRFLQEEVPKGSIEWVEDIAADDRISLRYADITRTGLADSSVDVVALSFVLHELPASVSQEVLHEAYRILKPGGVFYIAEMDPSTPGYRKLRANPLLFSVIRSTEPYLDEYFDVVAPNLPTMLQQQGFPVVRVGAATGRHFAMVAIKPGVADVRPSRAVRLASDQHLPTWKKEISPL